MINLLLLSADDSYINECGRLPLRPDYDKELLMNFCKNQVVSADGYNMLPPSMRQYVQVNKDNITLGITIPEIDELSDVLLVIRTNEILNGKTFRFDKFKLLTKQNQLEIWVRK